MNKKIPVALAILIIFLVIAIIVGISFWLCPKEKIENVACTQDAKLCSDGSYVGRSGPKCEFAECPVYNISCRENSKYFVILREFEPGVFDFLIKNKISEDQIIPCSYILDKADFELKSQIATYFLALTDNFLVLDKGTAPPPRVLIAYNLDSRKEVYTGSYSGTTSIRNVGVFNNVITYWSPTDEKVTNENCPKLSEYVAGGLGAEIEAYVSLDLSNLTKKESGEYRCSATQ